MALANVLFVVVHVIAAVRRGFLDLIPAALLLPVYWFAVAIATRRGFLQSFTRPFACVVARVRQPL